MNKRFNFETYFAFKFNMLVWNTKLNAHIKFKKSIRS